MLDATTWMLLAIAGPAFIAAAIAYALIKQRRLSAAERLDLREAVDEPYEEPDDEDGCPIRVNLDRRKQSADRSFRTTGTLAGQAR
jgi:hypothetical protein